MTSFKERFKEQERKKQDALETFIRPDYQFHDNFRKKFHCTTVESNGRRHYSISGISRPLPSVTTVISSTKSEYSERQLENWKKRVGQEEAERIKNAAADRGEALHKLCEAFILNDNFVAPQKGTNHFALFKQIYPFLHRINNIHMLEGVLFSERLNMAGRTDCVAEFDGVLSIIDFKSSVSVREDYYLQDYYCQETAYALMFSELYGSKVSQIVTLMAVDNDSLSKEGLLFIKKPVDYVEDLITRIKQYKLNISGPEAGIERA